MSVSTLGFETLALRELRSEWEQLNHSHFRRALRPPVFGITEAESVLGRWMRESRLLEFSRAFLLGRPWWEVVEVLRHEIAHQAVDELYGGEPEPHGPRFRSLCAHLGIDARASGLPEGQGEPRVLDRIRRLLSLAASDNPHEAEAAMNAAQRLMLEHNVEEVRERRERGYVHGVVGRPSGRSPRWRQRLEGLLMEHFFVEGVYVPAFDAARGMRGRILEIMGTEANVRMAQYVHDFVERAALSAYARYRAAGGAAGDKAKRDFLYGVVRGFDDKLRDERTSLAGTGLVYRGDPGLDDFKARRYPRLVSVARGAYAVGGSFEKGREAGRSLVLAKPVEAGSSGAAPKRLGRGDS